MQCNTGASVRKSVGVPGLEPSVHDRAQGTCAEEISLNLMSLNCKKFLDLTLKEVVGNFARTLSKFYWSLISGSLLLKKKRSFFLCILAPFFAERTSMHIFWYNF